MALHARSSCKLADALAGAEDGRGADEDCEGSGSFGGFFVLLKEFNSSYHNRDL